MHFLISAVVMGAGALMMIFRRRFGALSVVESAPLAGRSADPQWIAFAVRSAIATGVGFILFGGFRLVRAFEG